MAWTTQDAAAFYAIEEWGDGFFHIDGRGRMCVRPTGEGGASIPLTDVVASLDEEELRTPIVLRFPEILQARVDRLNQAFRQALADAGQKNARYRGVFPVKVNQHRDVVQAIAKAGRRWQHGLEVGSKAELIAALTMDPGRKSLLIVNGFKDDAFIEAACHATAFKDDVVLVIDAAEDLERILPLLGDLPRPPILGLRLKLRARATGRWAASGGAASKFGLTTTQVLWAVERLRKAGHLDRLQMLHFHIGSQIPSLDRVSASAREAARMHVELSRLGVPLRLLDVGGGMAVDPEGNADYDVEGFATAVVESVATVCEDADVPMPDLISESGRAVTAHHAVLVTDVLMDVPGDQRPARLPKTDLSADLARARFDAGRLGIEELAAAEWAEAPETRTKLVANLSLFQSLPDAWGIDQVFPVLPLSGLRREPTKAATVADITCDSDGEIRRYVTQEGIVERLPIHAGPHPHLGFFLVGAYQDALGDYHNLFGETDEATITTDAAGGWSLHRATPGSKVQDMLRWVQYDPADLRRRLRRRAHRLVEAGRIDEAEARTLIDRMMSLMSSRTYLEGA